MIFTFTKSRLPLFLTIFVSIVACVSAQASTVHDVNVVAIAVDDQTESARRSALTAAFQQVVVKMSGDRTKFSSRLLRNYAANDYLKAYQYEMNGAQLEYVATFDMAKIQQLLKLLNLPIWEARRPDTLLWLMTDTHPQLDGAILAESDLNPLNSVIDNINRQRGVDIILPIMDIEDRAAVTIYDVWGRFMNPVLSASERYSLDHVIAARIRETPSYDASELETRITELRNAQLGIKQLPQSSPAIEEESFVNQTLPIQYPGLDDSPQVGEDVLYSSVESAQVIPDPLFSIEEFRKLLNALQPYQLDYTFSIAGESQSGTLAGESAEQLLTEILTRYVDRLSQRYAVQLGQQTDGEVFALQVNNVDSLQKYTEVMQFLSTLTLVDSVMLIEQVGHTAQFQVSLLTDRARLIDTLLLDGRLMPLVNGFGEVVDDTQFFWKQ